MIDFSKIGQYRENNRIEAKKALGGLPKSIWETYSAFANTYGGIILLGVEELADKSFRTVDLPDPEGLVREFWAIVNDPGKTSVNVLSAKDVFVQDVDGDHIVVINVPRAERSCKPVYVDGSPLNTYRRSGEGDYRCTREEYQAMVRDAAVKTQDMDVLDGMDMDVFNRQSVRSYRRRMRLSRPGHVWEPLEDEDFLLKLGAAGAGSDGRNHPTCAGLLMLGSGAAITGQFSTYYLDYQEQCGGPARRTDRIVSDSGDWSGNVYDFYFRVYNRLILDASTPSRPEGGGEEDTRVRQALREALVNCLVNADYYGRGGVVIRKRRDSITLTNPGGFRIGIDAAKSGGVSDPRNETMLRMFNLIDIGRHDGSGIPNILRTWRERGWAMPEITERLEPERTTLTLLFAPNGGKEGAERGGKKVAIESAQQKEEILTYLTDHACATSSDIAGLLGVKSARAGKLLSELIAEGVVVAEGGDGNQSYRLKS